MLDKEELQHIADAINNYCKKNKCKIELKEILETDITEHRFLTNKYYYKLIAIKEEKIEC